MPLDDLPGPRPTTSTRVVLAEDDAEMRSLVAHALREDGADVEELATGRDLFARVLAALDATAAMPDVIVSDIRMPGASGLDVLRELRRRGCEVPVVLLTGFADQDLYDEVSSFTRATLFDKPFDIDDLLGAVTQETRGPGLCNPRAGGAKAFGQVGAQMDAFLDTPHAACCRTPPVAPPTGE